jgi:hypothetical protein
MFISKTKEWNGGAPLVSDSHAHGCSRCQDRRTRYSLKVFRRLACACTPQTHVKMGFATYRGHPTVSLFSPLQSTKRSLDMQKRLPGPSPFSFPFPASEIDISTSSYPISLFYTKLPFLISLVDGAHLSSFLPACQQHSLSSPLPSASELRKSSGPLPCSPENLQPLSLVGKICKKYGSGRFKAVTIPADATVSFFARGSLHNAYTCLQVPKPIGLTVPPLNPALPPRKVAKIPSRFRPPGAAIGETMGHGPKRVYLDVQARPPNVAYPPRPVPGSVADLDIVMDLCEFPSKVRYGPLLRVFRRHC